MVRGAAPLCFPYRRELAANPLFQVAFALQNAYEANYGLDTGRVVVLLNAGASAININILIGDQSVFTRDVSMGGNAFTEAVQKELNLPFDAAEELKRGHETDGVTYDGPAAEPTTVQGAVVPARLEGHDKTVDVGMLRLRFRGPVKLSEREHYTLYTFASALCTAIRNAQAYAELARAAARPDRVRPAPVVYGGWTAASETRSTVGEGFR